MGHQWVNVWGSSGAIYGAAMGQCMGHVWGSLWGRAEPHACPTGIFLQYAQLEEHYGMARRAMAVYERATRAVLPSERRAVFEVSIARAAELYGVTHTRPIYERAIEVRGTWGGMGGYGGVWGGYGGILGGYGGVWGDIGGNGGIWGAQRSQRGPHGPSVWGEWGVMGGYGGVGGDIGGIRGDMGGMRG